MDRAQALSLVMLFVFAMPLLLSVAEYLPVDADLVAGFFVATSLLFAAVFATGLLDSAASLAALLPLSVLLAVLAPALSFRLALPLSVTNQKLGSFKLSTDVAELSSHVSTFGAFFEPYVRLLAAAGSSAPRLVLSAVERDDIELLAEMPVSALNELSGRASTSLGATGGTLQLLYVKTTRRVKGENVVVVLPVLVPPLAPGDADNDQAPKPAWHPDYEPSEDELLAMPRKANKAQSAPTVWLSGELIPFDVSLPEATEYRLKKKYKNVRPMALLVNSGTGVGQPQDAAMPVFAYAALMAPLALLAARQLHIFYVALGARPKSRPAKACSKAECCD
jgi:hypothetical protein